MITSFFGPPFTGRAAPQFFRPDRAEQITGPPPDYTWLLFNGQKVYFNGEPVYVLKEST